MLSKALRLISKSSSLVGLIPHVKAVNNLKLTNKHRDRLWRLKEKKTVLGGMKEDDVCISVARAWTGRI